MAESVLLSGPFPALPEQLRVRHMLRCSVYRLRPVEKRGAIIVVGTIKNTKHTPSFCLTTAQQDPAKAVHLPGNFALSLFFQNDFFSIAAIAKSRRDKRQLCTSAALLTFWESANNFSSSPSISTDNSMCYCKI